MFNREVPSFLANCLRWKVTHRSRPRFQRNAAAHRVRSNHEERRVVSRARAAAEKSYEVLKVHRNTYQHKSLLRHASRAIYALSEWPTRSFHRHPGRAWSLFASPEDSSPRRHSWRRCLTQVPRAIPSTTALAGTRACPWAFTNFRSNANASSCRFS
jgi:hypothetical protein